MTILLPVPTVQAGMGELVFGDIFDANTFGGDHGVANTNSTDDHSTCKATGDYSPTCNGGDGSGGSGGAGCTGPSVNIGNENCKGGAGGSGTGGSGGSGRSGNSTSGQDGH